ncbi:MAG: DnaJ domain-containing protein [Campylobacter sp.]|nr:DnaJ domain-containing protein [Campylobacter sp.]
MSFWTIVFLIILYIIASKDGVFGGKSRANSLSFEEAKYLTALLAKVAKSDGRVNEIEAELISQSLDDLTYKLGGNSAVRNELKQIYNIEKENLNNVFSVAFEYKQRFKFDQNRAFGLIYYFLNLAYIDGEFSQSEKNTISQICDGFEISESLKQQIFAKFQSDFEQARAWKNRYSRQSQSGYGRGGSYGGNYGSRGGYGKNYNQNGYQRNSSSYKKEPEFDPYGVLGVSKNASFDEIKKKYRELVKKYHPDILMGKGADDEIVQEGTKKLQEINKAYEILKEKFGQ